MTKKGISLTWRKYICWDKPLVAQPLIYSSYKSYTHVSSANLASVNVILNRILSFTLDSQIYYLFIPWPRTLISFWVLVEPSLLFVTKIYKSSATMAIILICTYPFHHHQLTQYLDALWFQPLTHFFLLLPLVIAMYVYTLLSFYFPRVSKFLLLSEAIFRMPGVCPRCDKNVYFAEEVFLCPNVLIWFHICILGEGVGQVLPQDVLQVYWLRVDSPSIHPVNLKIWVKRWKYFSAIIGWR